MIDFDNIRNRNYCDAWYNSDFDYKVILGGPHLFCLNTKY